MGLRTAGRITAAQQRWEWVPSLILSVFVERGVWITCRSSVLFLEAYGSCLWAVPVHWEPKDESL